MSNDQNSNDLLARNLERAREEQHRAEDEALRQPLLCVGGPLHMQTYRFESGSMRFSYFALAGESAAYSLHRFIYQGDGTSRIVYLADSATDADRQEAGLPARPEGDEPYLSEAIETAIGTIVAMTIDGDAYLQQVALEKALRDFARAIIASK